MATTLQDQQIVATLNGAVSRGTIIDTSAGWTTNATNASTNDGDLMGILGRSGIPQLFAAKAQTATALKIVPMSEAIVADDTYPDKSPIYLIASKAAV